MKCPACQHDNEASALFCHPLTETATRLAGNLGAVNEIFAEIGQCEFLACANDWGAVSDAATDTLLGVRELTLDSPDGSDFDDLLGHSITYRIALGLPPGPQSVYGLLLVCKHIVRSEKVRLPTCIRSLNDAGSASVGP